jgi:outer membrane lipopolysaccharide assembly protein LptE/RlpB
LAISYGFNTKGRGQLQPILEILETQIKKKGHTCQVNQENQLQKTAVAVTVKAQAGHPM